MSDEDVKQLRRTVFQVHVSSIIEIFVFDSFHDFSEHHSILQSFWCVDSYKKRKKEKKKLKTSKAPLQYTTWSLN